MPTKVAYRNSLSKAERDALVLSCTRLAYKFAKQYEYAGVPKEDMEQAAFLGLAVAATRFNPELGWKFTTYAWQWLRNHLQKEQHAHRSGGFSGTWRTGDYPSRFWANDDDRESAEEYHTAKEDDYDGREEFWTAVLSRLVHPQQRRVIYLRYICGWTLSEIGWHLRLSKERARQIEQKALEVLRHDAGMELLATGGV